MTSLLREAAERLIGCHYDKNGIFEAPSGHTYSQCNDGLHVAKAYLKEQEQPCGKRMAEAVAHFLYWSGYLGREPNIHRAVLISTDGAEVDMGTQTFARLKETLDELHPDWRNWNRNYQQSTDSPDAGNEQ